MKTLVDLLLEKKKKEAKYFKNYQDYAAKIKKIATELLGEIKFFVFGSVVEREAEPDSDIDILIISPRLKSSLEKSRIRTEIYKKIGYHTPFEIHLITPEEYQNWYRCFIKKKIEI